MVIPDLIIIPDCGSNRDFPSVAAAYMGEIYDCRVIDFNTVPGNEEQRLLAGYPIFFGFVSPVRAAAEMDKLAGLIRKTGQEWIGTIETPVDIQCCYPFLQGDNHLRCKIPFGDNLPYPDYSRFDSWSVISENWKARRWFFPLMTSLGCSFTCTYCAARKRPQHFRTIENCIEELALAQRKWGIHQFVIIDDCFNALPDRAKDFARCVKPLGLSWMAGNGLRADRFDSELGSLMSSSGCKWVSFGVESTDDRVLSKVRKGERFEQINEAVRSAKEYFEYVGVFLILGLPGSTYLSDRQGIEWARGLGLGIHLSFYVPFDQGRQCNVLFDSPIGRELPQTYDYHQMLKLYRLVNE